MQKPNFKLKETLIGVGLLTLVGAVGAQTYYAHELSTRLAEQEAASAGLALPAPARPAQTTMYRGQSDPWSAMHAEMAQMQAQMDQMFGGAFQGIPVMAVGGQRPAVGSLTLDEQGNDYVVKAEVPGAADGDIQVNVEGRVLRISGETHGQEQQSADNGQVAREEHFSSSFQQAFTLPGPVDGTKMHSQYQDGVLTVTIPKAS